MKRSIAKMQEGRKKAARNPSYASISYAFSMLEGGKDEGMRYALLASGNPDNAHADAMKAVVDAYWKLGDFDRRVSLIDDLCIEVGLRPRHFLMETIGEMYDYKMNVSRLVASEAQLEATQSLGRMAVQDTDIEAKKMLFTHTGFLPQPKGLTVNSYTSVGTHVSLPAAEQTGLPAFEDGVVATSNALRHVDSPALPVHVQPENDLKESG